MRDRSDNPWHHERTLYHGATKLAASQECASVNVLWCCTGTGAVGISSKWCMADVRISVTWASLAQLPSLPDRYC